MTDILAVVAAVLLVGGSVFAFVGALGLMRFPDVFTRMHAASKAGTLGSCLTLLAVAVHSPTLDILPKAIAGIVFFMLTVPISAHLLARGAIKAGHLPITGGADSAAAERKDA